MAGFIYLSVALTIGKYIVYLSVALTTGKYREKKNTLGQEKNLSLPRV